MTIHNSVGLSLLSLLAVFPAQAIPTFTLTSPAPNASLPAGTVLIQFFASDFNLGDQGQTHLHFYLDADPITYHFYNGGTRQVLYQGLHTHQIHWRSTTSIEIYGLSSGAHQVRFVLANGNHTELVNPEATKTLNFTLLAPLPSQFTLQAVATNLSFPVGMAFAPDGRLFYNEWATGKVRVIDPGWSLRQQPFFAVTDLITGGEQGMLGLAVDPDFANNHYIYIYYDANNPRRCRLLRLTDVNSVGTNPTYLLDNLPEGDIHNSGAVNFGPDGKLYITTGDSTVASEGDPEPDTNPRSESQNPNSLNGKVLRVNKDGTIPADNPTAGSPVWARGLRNTFGTTFHPDTGDLWGTENGPDDNDEVNRLVRSGNYGWPIVRGIVNNPDYVDPLVAFTPTIAPTGIVALRPNTVYPVTYQHNLFFNDWKNGKIQRIILTGPGLNQLGSLSTAFNGGGGGLVAMTQGLDGYIYVSSNAAIYRMVLIGSQAPSAVSVSPANGSGFTQLFTFNFSDPNGYTDIPAAEMLFNTTLNLANACYLRYSRTANNVSLRNDNNSAWLGPVNLGSGATLENSQCKFNSTGSSASSSGTDVTVRLNLTFKQTFLGTKQIDMQTTDTTGLATGWQQRGVWSVGTVNLAPSAVSVSPASGSGARQVFSFLFSDPNGAADLLWTQMLVNSPLNITNGCYLHYNRSYNVVYLRDDASTAWLGPVPLGTATTLENSQCIVNVGTSSRNVARNSLAENAAEVAGTDMTVNLDLSFKTAFSGPKSVYMYAQDLAGLSSGWQNRGTWTGSVGSPVAPTTVSVTPSSGSGSRQTFSFLYSDGNGFTDLPWTQMLVNNVLSIFNGCYVHYDRAFNAVFLRDDGSTTWLGPVTLGAATTLENSQCVLNAATSSASGATTNLTVNLDLSFKPAFAGTKGVFMQTQDTGGLATGWQSEGAWTVPGAGGGNLPPSAVSVTPASGSGARQTFAFLFSDPNGFTDLPWTQIIVNGALSIFNGCYVHHDRAFNVVYLRNDDSTAWLGPVSLGTAVTLENSQCTVYAATSSASGSTTNLTVNLDLGFKPAFTGAKGVFMQTQDVAGAATSWQTRGAWTAP